MFCQKCGKEISDTSKFCAFCGAPAQAPQPSGMPAMQNAPDTFEEEPTIRENVTATDVPFDEEATVVMRDPAPKNTEEPKTDAVASEEEIPVPEVNPEPIPVVPVQEVTPEPIPVVPVQEEPSASYEAAQNTETPFAAADQGGSSDMPKKSHTGAVIAVLGVIAVAIVAVIIILAKLLFGGNKLDSRLFYMKDNELSAITDITDSNPEDVQIEDIKNDGYLSAYQLVRLSSDGNYLYYFSDVDSSGETGTLCRIPTAKVKLKESANDKLVEEIDSKVNISRGYTVLEDNSVVYIRKSDELTWYNGSESYELGENDGYSYYVTDDEKYVIYLDEDDTLIATEISKKATSTEIDDDVDSLNAVGDKDFILYNCQDGDDGYEYYVAGVSKEPEVVAEDMDGYYAVSTEDKSFYYTIREENEYCLYDYVIDPYAEEDANIKEPVARDYMKAVKAKDAISEYDQEYYSNMDDFKDGELYYYSDYYEAWEYYNYDDYEYYYYDEDEDQWYTSPDYDAYNEAYDAYYAVSDRIYLREDLKEETITDSYYKLYYYKNGESTEVCSSVENIMANHRQALIYTKTNEDGSATAKYNIDDIYSTYQLEEWIEYGEDGDSEDVKETYYFVNAGAGESEVTGLDSVSDLKMSKDGKIAVIYGDYEDDGYTMLSYSVSSSGLSNETEVSDAATNLSVYQNEFYYFDDIEDEVGTLYAFDGSKSYLLAKDIVPYDIFYTEDGKIIGYSDRDYEEGDLAVYDKNGDDERVAKKVTSFTYVGKNCYLVMKDDDLYYLDKKGNETRLAKNVSYYLYPGSVDGHWIY